MFCFAYPYIGSWVKRVDVVECGWNEKGATKLGHLMSIRADEELPLLLLRPDLNKLETD